MDDLLSEEHELHLLRKQVESLAKQQNRQLEVFEKISNDLKDIQVSVVFMVIIFLLALLVYVFRSGV